MEDPWETVGTVGLFGGKWPRPGRSVRARDTSKPLRHPDHNEHGASRDEDEGRWPDRQPHSDCKHAPDQPAPGNTHRPTIAFIPLAKWSFRPVSRDRVPVAFPASRANAPSTRSVVRGSRELGGPGTKPSLDATTRWTARARGQ